MNTTTLHQLLGQALQHLHEHEIDKADEIFMSIEKSMFNMKGKSSAMRVYTSVRSIRTSVESGQIRHAMRSTQKAIHGGNWRSRAKESSMEDLVRASGCLKG
tara:strand:+ start:1852 stop:2157 length:306 start_codon:yes stop_codon:yes gene_type:complete